MSLRTFFALDGKHWLDEMRQIQTEESELRDLGLAIGDLSRAAATDQRTPEQEDELDEEDPAGDDAEEDDDDDDTTPPNKK
jgi:hypothetical protein